MSMPHSTYTGKQPSKNQGFRIYCSGPFSRTSASVITWKFIFFGCSPVCRGAPIDVFANLSIIRSSGAVYDIQTPVHVMERRSDRFYDCRALTCCRMVLCVECVAAARTTHMPATHTATQPQSSTSGTRISIDPFMLASIYLPIQIRLCGRVPGRWPMRPTYPAVPTCRRSTTRAWPW